METLGRQLIAAIAEEQDSQISAAEPEPEVGALALAPPADDPIAQIARLDELRRAGILTDEEFAAKKADLLGRL